MYYIDINNAGLSEPQIQAIHLAFSALIQGSQSVTRWGCFPASRRLVVNVAPSFPEREIREERGTLVWTMDFLAREALDRHTRTSTP